MWQANLIKATFMKNYYRQGGKIQPENTIASCEQQIKHRKL